MHMCICIYVLVQNFVGGFFLRLLKDPSLLRLKPFILYFQFIKNCLITLM